MYETTKVCNDNLKICFSYKRCRDIYGFDYYLPISTFYKYGTVRNSSSEEHKNLKSISRPMPLLLPNVKLVQCLLANIAVHVLANNNIVAAVHCKHLCSDV